jgi:sugar lactone lactonase YvrE
LTLRDHDKLAPLRRAARHANGIALFRSVVFYSIRHMILFHMRSCRREQVDFGCSPAHHSDSFRHEHTKGEPMKIRNTVIASTLLLSAAIWLPAWADDDDDPPQFPQPATFSTLVKTDFQVEGLTGDATGNLYTAGRQTTNNLPCPVYRVNLASPVEPPPTVGLIPDPDGTGASLCNPAGIAFNDAGDLFVADSGVAARIYFFPAGTLSGTTPPIATIFATGVPGTNGLAFDRDGNLWTGDGTTGRGRVWKIAPCAVPTCAAVEMFRIQPMRNTTALGGDIADNVTVNGVTVVNAVGRQARTFPPGTLANTAGGQDLVANGLAFNRGGDLFVADTARGAIWKVEFNSDGTLKSGQTDCDTTFAPGTLCLDNIFVTHPLLEGTDGIALDRAGNIWNSANERNAIVVVTKDGRVAEIFRNPVNSAGFRNSADPISAPVAGDAHILEFPTSPFLAGRDFCTSNSDGDRRDNSPNVGGEVSPSASPRGKISCMDQRLPVRGVTLPVR